jgi:hypothetical protein
MGLRYRRAPGTTCDTRDHASDFGQAQEILGTDTATATVHKALDDVVRRFHISQLLEWDFDGMTNDELEASQRSTFERLDELPLTDGREAS